MSSHVVKVKCNQSQAVTATLYRNEHWTEHCQTLLLVQLIITCHLFLLTENSITTLQSEDYSLPLNIFFHKSKLSNTLTLPVTSLMNLLQAVALLDCRLVSLHSRRTHDNIKKHSHVHWDWSHVHSAHTCTGTDRLIDWLSSVLRPLQHRIGYMGDGFYRSKDPTNSIKVLKEDLQKTKQTTKTTKYTNAHTIIETQKDIHKISTTSPLVYTNMGWLGDSSHRGQDR